MKKHKKPQKRRTKDKTVKTTSILFLTLVFALMLSGAASAGTPLAENQTGTVSGDLYVNTTDGWPSSTQGATNEVTQANTLPAYTSIDSAMVYVNVYSGSGSNNWPVRTTIKLDGNGDGDYDDPGELLGVEDMNIPGTTDGTVYWLNDHCNRVYSDYQVWYDVKNLITSNNPTLYVKTENMGGDGYDGRIKLLALTVAYNDGDTDQVHYWVLNGQDWINTDTSPSSSIFNTSSFTGEVSSATLNTVALSGTDGTYTLNTSSLTGNLTETGTYYKEHQWDVTSNINTGTNTNLTYANIGSSLKMNLATLTIRETAVAAPVADFTTDKTSGTAPLTINFTNNSTGTITSYAWDFTGDGTTDSNDPNPTWTYTNAGSYTVKLTVTGPGGTDTETKSNYIAVIPGNYVSYLGGTSTEYVYGIAVDSQGNMYITGSTASADFPTTADAYQTSYGGSYTTFLSKFNSSGQLVYGTYIGGGTDRSEYGYDIAVDNQGNMYITGYRMITNQGYDAFVYKFNSSGQLVYSNYFGGTGNERGCRIVVDSTGNAYIVGYTSGGNFPTTADAYQKTYGGGSWDAFFSKFDSSGQLVYSTYLGGTSSDGQYSNHICLGITLDNEENVYISGTTQSTNFPTTSGAYQTTYGGGSYDTFLSKFNSSGQLVYSTFLGGTGSDFGSSMAVDSAGSVYVTGRTASTNFPITSGAYQTTYGGGSYDAFISKFNSTGQLVYSTYLGGTGTEYGTNIKVDSTGNAYATGYTASTNFPITTGAHQTTYGGGSYDVFMTKLNSTGNGIISSTYLGGTTEDDGYSIALDCEGNAYITGITRGDFPTTIEAYQSTFLAGGYDGFFAKFDLTPPVAGFTADVLSDYAPLTVHFTDQSTSSTPLIWNWDFDNNGTVDSTAQNPTYTYSTPGVYTVKLTVYNQSGSDSVTKTGYITVIEVPNDTEAPTVTANPVGGTYTSTTHVVLSTTDNFDTNPKIYYTINGTDPTTESTQYTSPLTFIETTTLKFIAADKFGNISPIHTENYVINDNEAPTVTANLTSGTYNPPIQVNLSASDNTDPNPVIYYTLDNTDPTTSSTIYTGAINITQTTTLKFIAIDSKGNVSSVHTETYTIEDTEAPTTTATQNGTTITLSATDNSDPTPAIYYTTNGDEPTTGSTPYSGPFTIPPAAITVVKFLALDTSGNTSPVQSRSFNTTRSTDLLTGYYAEGNVGVIISNGGTGYTWFAHNTPGTGTVTYTASSLNIPTGATILSARLYQAWTWYGYPGYTLQFNGQNVPVTVHYPDGNDGQDVFDVTSYFIANGDNTAVLTSGGGASYGTILIVVYQSTSEPYRKIWVNEGFDIIPGYSNYGATEGPGHAYFNNVTNTNIGTAQIITLLPSGDNDSPNILLNGQTFTINSAGGSDPAYKYYNINPAALQNGTNVVEVPNGGYMSISNAILTLTMPPADLAISDIQTSNPQVGTSSPVTATITNNGGTDASNFLAKFYDNNIQVAKTTITSLAAGASLPVSFDWTPSTTGNHVLAIITDAGSQITESDENNNLVSVEVAVSPSAQPDLIATNLMLPVSQVIGTTSPVTVTITNQGAVDSSAFVVKLYDNNIQYATINLTGLAAGASTDVIFDWLTYTTGQHNLSVIADANQQISEYNEANNQISQQATVNQSTLSDISVSNLQTPVSPAVAVNSQVTATVTNLGTVDSGAFVVKLYDNNTQIAKINLTGLAAGASTDVTFNWSTLTSGTHNLSVIADANQQITEYNENNNQISQQATVNPSTQPDLSVTNLQLPANPAAGTTYQITVTITNQGTIDTAAFAVKLYDNNTQLGKINITSLTAGTSTQVTFNWTPTTGTHNLAIKADANQQITEYNEANNQISQQATVN